MNKDEFDIRGGANKKLTYTGKRQFRGFETSVQIFGGFWNLHALAEKKQF